MNGSLIIEYKNVRVVIWVLNILLQLFVIMSMIPHGGFTFYTPWSVWALVISLILSMVIFAKEKYLFMKLIAAVFIFVSGLNVVSFHSSYDYLIRKYIDRP